MIIDRHPDEIESLSLNFDGKLAVSSCEGERLGTYLGNVDWAYPHAKKSSNYLLDLGLPNFMGNFLTDGAEERTRTSTP